MASPPAATAPSGDVSALDTPGLLLALAPPLGESARARPGLLAPPPAPPTDGSLACLARGGCEGARSSRGERGLLRTNEPLLPDETMGEADPGAAPSSSLPVDLDRSERPTNRALTFSKMERGLAVSDPDEDSGTFPAITTPLLAGWLCVPPASGGMSSRLPPELVPFSCQKEKTGERMTAYAAW